MKKRRGDTETRRHGDRKAGLRVSASVRRRSDGSTSKSRTRSPRHGVPTSPRPPSAPITLLTDFGSSDYFVGVMKGVILSVNPDARIVDITHEIPPHDIAGAAFTLSVACRSFPAQTIHLSVVDPGVGSARRPILVMAGEQFFVGPDNGIFSYVIEGAARAHVVHLTNPKYFQHPVSDTFHGRDIFAPVAGALSNGVTAAELGTEIDDYVRLEPLAPDKLGKGKLGARIIHIDRFGNCVTNLTKEVLTPEMIRDGAQLTLNGKTIKAFRRFFSDKGDNDQMLFAVWGSAGFLEVAATNRSAAKLLKARRGQRVLVSTY